MTVVHVNASRGYEVKIGRGLLAEVGGEAAKITGGQVIVVTDETVAPLYLQQAVSALRQADLTVSSASVPAGETSKSPEYYVNLLNIFAAKRLTRSDAVIALGGGVVGDLTGFAAATYLRGVPVLQIPTTLLAMVDSSVGGKTAIDLPAGKNLVGAFHQPSAVLCDPDVLSTLPADVFRDGCAEVVKTAVLFDRALFDHLHAHGADFDREMVISRCVAHKRDVVCRDEFDTGERQLLNLGHTVGHAIEKCSNFTVSHGKAVAIGTAVMARAFCAEADEIVALLRAFGLPTDTAFSPEELAAAALSDKKRSGGEITLVVPERIGRASLKKIPVGDLLTVIKAGF